MSAVDLVVAAALESWSERAQRAVFYARAVCKGKGYALGVHGTFRQDIDIVAVPWTEKAVAPDVLACAILDALVKWRIALGWDSSGTDGTAKPHGRHAWGIVLAGEPFMYLDLSVMPRAAERTATLNKVET
jgi:hypothetical protein